MNNLPKKFDSLAKLINLVSSCDSLKKRKIIELIFINVFKDWFSEVNELHDLEENITHIVHYTSLDMLISVLGREVELHDGGKTQNSKTIKTGEFIRMYDSFHLNDPSEGKYLVGFIKDRQYLNRNFQTHHSYIASFIISSENDINEDRLEYWRAYGHEGRGCSIKIPVGNGNKLNRSIFRRVIYGEELTKKSAKSLDGFVFKHIWQGLAPKIRADDEELVRSVFFKTIQSQVNRISYLYKNDSYKYERECRVVKSVLEIDKSDLNFKNPRHYLNEDGLSIRNHILITGSSITIGPLVSNQESIKFSINNLLSRAGMTGTKVKISGIPYRASS